MATPLRATLCRSLFAIALVSLLSTALFPGIAFGLPLVAITRPTNGSTVSGVIWIDVAFSADSNRPITRLEVYIDDALAREMDLPSPLLQGRQSFNWDFTYVSNTVHKISARAIDAGGYANTAAISVNVQNAAVGGPDRIPPVVRIYYPAQGARLRGPVEIKAEAQDNVGVELVYFYVDGKLHKMMMKAPPYVDLWDTGREADGNHVLEAVAVDAAENEARSAQVTVIVENHSMTLAGAGNDSQRSGVGGALPAPPTVAGGPVLPSQPELSSPLPVSPSQPLGPVASIPAPPVGPAPSLILPGTAGPAEFSRPPTTVATGRAATSGGAPVLPGQTALTAPSAAATSQPSLGGPTLAAGPSQPTVAGGPRLAMVAPQTRALEPVPQAPATTSLTMAPEKPVSVRTSRPANVTPVAGNVTPLLGAGLLSRPTLVAMNAPAVTAGSGLSKTTGPATAAPILPVTATSRPAPTVTASLPASAPVPTPVKSAVPAPKASVSIPTVTPSQLAPLASRPRPTQTWQPTGLSKSSAPAARVATTATAAAKSTPAASSARPGPAPVSSARSSLAPLSPRLTGPALRQTVTPVGSPALAGTPQRTTLAPIVAVAPMPQSLPTARAGRVSAPRQVATAVRPTMAPVSLAQAALTAADSAPIPAARMLARLPEPSEFGQLPADGRLTKPGPTSAAVPLMVAKMRDIKILFDGEILTLRATPETRQGLALAPLREIFEHTDGVLYWFPVEKKVQAVNKSVTMKLQIGDPKVQVNGEDRVLAVAPYIKQGRTMVPLQFIADTLDVQITFDSQTGNILIASNQQ